MCFLLLPTSPLFFFGGGGGGATSGIYGRGPTSCIDGRFKK